jgi:translation elongation factor aEF-1 beta
MANAIITFEIMPESPDVDMESLKEKVLEIVKNAGAKGQMQTKIEPIAFGLKKIIVYAMFEVSNNQDFDAISDKMETLEGVGNAKVANMDLAMG